MKVNRKYKVNSKRKKTISPIKITVLFIILISTLSVGYALMTDMLTINGTANIGSFTITYNLNGGTNVANPITEYYATTNAPLPIPTNGNYSFGGWYENDMFTGSAITTTPTRK